MCGQGWSGTHYVTLISLQLAILLFHPPGCWDYRPASSLCSFSSQYSPAFLALFFPSRFSFLCAVPWGVQFQIRREWMQVLQNESRRLLIYDGCFGFCLETESSCMAQAGLELRSSCLSLPLFRNICKARVSFVWLGIDLKSGAEAEGVAGGQCGWGLVTNVLPAPPAKAFGPRGLRQQAVLPGGHLRQMMHRCHKINLSNQT